MNEQARQNSQWQGRIKRLLREGWGVEDMAARHNICIRAARREVQILRETGELKVIYQEARS